MSLGEDQMLTLAYVALLHKTNQKDMKRMSVPNVSELQSHA